MEEKKLILDDELNAEGGLGGAGFPTHVTSSPHVRQQEEAYAADADALNTHHQYVAGSRSDEILLDEVLCASGGTAALQGAGVGKTVLISETDALHVFIPPRDAAFDDKPLYGAENSAASGYGLYRKEQEFDVELR